MKRVSKDSVIKDKEYFNTKFLQVKINAKKSMRK